MTEMIRGVRVIDDDGAMRRQVREWHDTSLTVALVPTMGNLHDGHLSLVEAARRQADRVVASVFVNPTQFGPGEDYEAYPRTLPDDCERLAPLEVDAVFAPAVAVMYPEGPALRTRIEVPGISEDLCGAGRPGHFTGVATVVGKLFNIVQPDVAVFGRKDYQQLLVIQRMVTDLRIPVRVVGAPTLRESDGLAMSSRNGYLKADERRRAPALYESLVEAGERYRTGADDLRAVEADADAALREAGLDPEYVRIADPDTLRPASAGAPAVVILAAAWLGRARLIDNVAVALDADGG